MDNWAWQVPFLSMAGVGLRLPKVWASLLSHLLPVFHLASLISLFFLTEPYQCSTWPRCVQGWAETWKVEPCLNIRPGFLRNATGFFAQGGVLPPKCFHFISFKNLDFLFPFYFFYLGCCNLSCAEFEGLWYLKVTFVPACHLISGGITVFCASLSKVLALGISIAQCVWRHICWSPGCAACVWSPKWRYGELDLGQ